MKTLYEEIRSLCGNGGPIDRENCLFRSGGYLMKRFITFLVTLSVFLGITWLGGYDFNERNPMIAWWFIVGIWVSAAFSSTFGETK